MKATFQDQILYHGDFLWDWQKVKPGSIDLVLTDPPFGAITQAQRWDRRPNFHVLAWDFRTIIKSTAQVAIFSNFQAATEIENAFSRYYAFRFNWIWQKPSVPNKSRTRPASDVELILVYRPKGTKVEELTFHYDDLVEHGEPYSRQAGRSQNRNPTLNKGGNLPERYVNETGERKPRSVLYYPNKPCMRAAERTSHPTQKPVALLEYILKALTNPGDLVLDPFAGSSSTLIAAHRLGRRGVGFEICKEYYEMGCDRLARETGEVAQP